MKFEHAKSILTGIPYISAKRAESLYNFILEHGPRDCLELGFAHGASVCYAAAALEEIGTGHITAVDLECGREWQNPSIEELLERTGLSSYVSIHRETTSYSWFLKKKIEDKTNSGACTPVYDFCYIDGAKNWTIDGATFFLVDKLLKKNGFILFDDMKWSYGMASEWSVTKLEESGVLVRNMSADELSHPHVEAIFRLLVMQHPSYSNFTIENEDWGWAQKIASEHAKLTIKKTTETSGLLKKITRRVLRPLRSI